MAEQKIAPLDEEDLARLNKMRVWVRDHYTPEAQDRFEPYEGKLALIQRILEMRWVDSSETWKLQSLGAVFGDALAQYAGLEWVAVEDEYGRDPALRHPVASLEVFPLTTISKRIERGETVDVFVLFKQACESIADILGTLPAGRKH